MKGEKFVLGVFDDEDVLLSGVKQVRGEGVKIHEVYSPFPVHGVGHALGYKRSKLSIAAFFFGVAGTGLAILMQTYMMGIDWPMVIGGKDFTPAPTFVPVTFELTVLLAALGMVATFLITNDLRPYGRAKVFDLRQTDDKHIVAINLNKNGGNRNEIERILKDSGATEVNDKTVAWAS
jgi:hypothetical protein